MKVLGWLKAVLSIVIALAIGLAVTGIVNLLHPAPGDVGWALGSVLTASVLSAAVAFFVTNPRKKPPVAAPREGPAGKEADTGTKKP